MNRSVLDYIESKQLRQDVTAFNTGDTVRVLWKVKEGEKEREQAFEGVVIRKKRGANRASFTVRKTSFGVGVERIFPLHSPRYSKIEILSRGSVNRNRLFYLRALKGKASRVDKDESESAARGGGGGTPTPAAKGPKAEAGSKKT